ncbi:hypothetical protein [Jeotgalibacillus malaysiensis]|uniref:hypothetical protein n=1 Tax=Jeotgalibacillus malaysiensis TaxID=1508404 RepID=UPI00384F47FB
MKGEMKEEREIEFISLVNGYGVTSRVEELRPQEYVLFRHRADTQENVQMTAIKTTKPINNIFLIVSSRIRKGRC